MPQYRITYHVHAGHEFVVEADTEDEANDLAREMWVRGEGELIYDETDHIEINKEI